MAHGIQLLIFSLFAVFQDVQVTHLGSWRTPAPPPVNLKFVADNNGDLRIDGNLITQAAYNSQGKGYFTSSFSLITIKVEDTGGNTGAIFALNSPLTYTDLTWRCSSNLTTGWDSNLRYDDSLWPKAVEGSSSVRSAYNGNSAAKVIKADDNSFPFGCRYRFKLFSDPKLLQYNPCNTQDLNTLLDSDLGTCIPVTSLTTRTLSIRLKLTKARATFDVVVSVKNLQTCESSFINVFTEASQLTDNFYGTFKSCDFVAKATTWLGVSQCQYTCNCNNCAYAFVKIQKRPPPFVDISNWEICEVYP